MLRDAYDHAQGRGTPGWSSLYRPCPRIGDLRALNGLTIRGFMTDGDNDDTPHRIEFWPRFIRITSAGIHEWERILAERMIKESP